MIKGSERRQSVMRKIQSAKTSESPHPRRKRGKEIIAEIKTSYSLGDLFEIVGEGGKFLIREIEIQPIKEVSQGKEKVVHFQEEKGSLPLK